VAGAKRRVVRAACPGEAYGEGRGTAFVPHALPQPPPRRGGGLLPRALARGLGFEAGQPPRRGGGMIIGAGVLPVLARGGEFSLTEIAKGRKGERGEGTTDEHG